MDNFSGSYEKEDVEFLLKKIDIQLTSQKEKEFLIQSKHFHYSEMLSPEYVPTKSYLKVFYETFELNKYKFSSDILQFSNNLQNKNLVLVSLVRAGTPIGVLLKRTLRDIFNKNVKHYSISIIRDKEIDEEALKYIIKNNPKKEIVFIDGWTGKGVINRELKKFIKKFNLKYNQNISDNLYVVSDIAGVADFSITREDYLIPSSALNSTISGLVSRSILNDKYIQQGDFHGCKFYEEYKTNDLSLWFIEEIMKIIKTLPIEKKEFIKKDDIYNKKINLFLNKVQKKYGIKDINFIKPGIGEATRVLLRREPYLIFIKEELKILKHIIQLAKEKNIKVVKDKNLPFNALSIIKNVV